MESFAGRQEDVTASPPQPSQQQRPLRGFFLPYYAVSHQISHVHFAILLASRGVDSTILLTPANAPLSRAKVDRAASSGLPVRILIYPFPSAAAGLPAGYENNAQAAANDELKFVEAAEHAREAVEPLIRCHRPDFFAADSIFIWRTWAASDLRIPRLSFFPISVFSLSVMNAVVRRGFDESLSDDAPFFVAGIPDPPVQLVKAELPEFMRYEDSTVLQDFQAADRAAFGTIFNTFSAIDQRYVDHVRQGEDGLSRVWCVGPLALFYDASEASNGGKHSSTINDSSTTAKAEKNPKCLEWLDSQEAGSVIYVCFGTWCSLTADQHREMALGLEESGHPFLWAVKDEGELPWLPDGFEARVKGKGLMVRGWAPQVPILNHPSVGAFLTHCGWNSVMEAVAAGLPLLTWPLGVEQFINERMVVDVMGIGSKVWGGFRSTVEEEKVLVPREAIATAVKGFMGGGEEMEQKKKKAKEWGQMARLAVREAGSSHDDLNRLIDDVRAWHSEKLNR